MKRKLLTAALAAVLTIGCVSASGWAENMDGYMLLYENTFDSGAEGGAEAFNQQTEHFDLTLSVAKTGWQTAVFEGNNGVSTRPKAWPAERTMLFDFTKNGVKAGVSSGIYVLSFDFSSTAGGGDVAWMGQNFDDNSKQYEGKRMLYARALNGSRVFGATLNAGGWTNDTQSVMTLEDEKKYHVESVMNLNTKTAHTYVDGVLLGKTTGSVSPMNNYSIALSGHWDYFDNLKLEFYESMPMKANVREAAMDKIVLEFTDGIADETVLEGGAVIKNRYTGETISAQIEVNGRRAEILPVTELEVGYAYTLLLPDGIKGNEGGVLAENTLTFSLAEQNALKKLQLKDLQGEVLDLAETNPAELQSLVFEFTEDVTAATALETLSITDEAGDAVQFEIKAEGCVGEAVLSEVLKGNAQYRLVLEGLSVRYEIALNTAEGSLKASPLQLFKADGKTPITSLGDFSEGEIVRVRFRIVNTGDGTENGNSAIAMFNGKLMTGIDFEWVSLPPGSSKTMEFEFSAADKSDLRFTGTLWNGAEVWPLIAEQNFVFE